jgi:hypothetical protein
MNHRVTLVSGRDYRHRRPEMSIAVKAGVPHVLLGRSRFFRVTGARRDRQLRWQRTPVCAGFYGDVAHPIVIVSTKRKRERGGAALATRDEYVGMGD